MNTKKEKNKKKNEYSERNTPRLTSSFQGKYGNFPSDDELYYRWNSCPFFTTYRDGRLNELLEALLPVFRYFHFYRLQNTTVGFAKWRRIFNSYISKSLAEPNFIKKNWLKLERYFINFFAIFHPWKYFDVITPFFPYRFDYFGGCVEAVIKNQKGVRLYDYCFDEKTDSDNINLHGFKLQCAARFFHLKTKIRPESMAIAYPANKNVVYLNYSEKERIEEKKDFPDKRFRKYGKHCKICLRRKCKPLIDREDKYGWNLVR